MSSYETVETLLEDSKISGTSFKESQVIISVKPGRNELFTFYHIDDPNRDLKIQQVIQSTEGTGIVDLIIRYQRIMQMSVLLTYTDAKGRDIKHGVDQIIDTHKKLSSFCNHERIHITNYFFAAIIVQRNSAPSVLAAEISYLKRKIQKHTKISIEMIKVIKVHQNGDQISGVIRGFYDQIE